MKVSSIEKLFDNLKCVSNPQNANFDDLTFDIDKILIIRQWTHGTNDNNVESLNNSLSLTYIQNKCKNNKSLVWCIDWLAIKTVYVITEITTLMT